jgi:chemotaxis protein MotB
VAADKGKKIVIVRKKKVAGGGHHGGSWKVAYADFVTAMMAFFMVMWILGMDEQTKQAIEGYFSNPVGYKKGYGAGSSPIGNGASPARAASSQIRLLARAAEGQRLAAVARAVQQAVQGDGSLKKLGAKVEVKVGKDGLRIELVESGSGDVFFPVGSTTMKPAAVIALQLITPALGSTSNPIIVEGHTDAARFGTSAQYGNWELSGERANAARRVMEASGLPAGRVAEVRGLADRDPRVAGDPYAAANRRITIFLPYSTPHPDAPIAGDAPAERPAGHPVAAERPPVRAAHAPRAVALAPAAGAD